MVVFFSSLTRTTELDKEKPHITLEQKFILHFKCHPNCLLFRRQFFFLRMCIELDIDNDSKVFCYQFSLLENVIQRLEQNGK